MPASTTTFEQRIARIHQRAETGENIGFVEPGVSEEPVSPRTAQKLAKRAGGKPRSRYLVSVLGGLVTSFAIVGIGAAVLMGSGGEGNFEDIIAAVLLPAD